MGIKKLAPWNWFKKEEEDAGKIVPVQNSTTQMGRYALPGGFDQFHQELDRLIDQMMGDFGLPLSKGYGSSLSRLSDTLLRPTLDIDATDKTYNVSVEIPGVREKDVRIELLNGTLTIRGEKKQEKEDKNKFYYCVERSYGSFHRVLTLPEDVDENQIRATFKKGVLNITIPRRMAAKPAAKQIEVKSAA